MMQLGDESDLPAGAAVGEYRIERVLGSGGMGTVYAAIHPVIGKKAAVKVLKAPLCSNPLAVQRFVDEARAVNQIGHQNIVDIFAFGALPDGRSYLVMEWLDGETLEQRLVRGRALPAEAAQILDQLCDALEAVHEKGIIHRDLKPANLFLVPDRAGFSLKLLDFGIAKLDTPAVAQAVAAASRRDTNPQTLLGTPAYVSPEQARSDAVDFRSDVYSMGVIAFEMFLGRVPFDADNLVEILFQHMRRTPPRPRDLWPEIPPALEELLVAMLAKEPDDRPGLAEIRATLAQIRAAALLLTADRTLRDTSRRALLLRRPVLARSYEGVGPLLAPLLGELSHGVTWIPTRGAAPLPGTPITLRFEIESLALQLDFGGIAERHFGTDATKTMVRYDRVPTPRLEAIFGAASTIPLHADEGDPVTAEWRRPAATRTAAWSRGVAASKGFVGEPEVTEGRTQVLEAWDGDITKTKPPVLELSAEAPIKKQPATRRARGLALKMLLSSLVLIAGAVLAITGIAVQRVETDRTFYVRDLNLRMAGVLGDALGNQLDNWRDRLQVAATADGAGEIPLGDFIAVARCEGVRCRTLGGKELNARALADAPPPTSEALSLLVSGEQVVARMKHGGIIALGVAPKSALLGDATKVAQDFTVLVVDGDLRVLAAAGPDRDAVALEHQARALVPDLGSRAEGASGALEFVVPSGIPMLGAFKKTHDLGVIVTVPRAVTAEASRVLTRQVALIAGVVLAVALAMSLLFTGTITRRLARLTELASRVASGDFSTKATVGGTDEVAEVARSFDAMVQALQERDDEVLRIQRQMREDETKAIHQQLSKWLESDLASRLNAIQEVVDRPAHRTFDVEQKHIRLRELSREASASLQHALVFAAIAHKRVDFAQAVGEAVRLARAELKGKVEIDLDAVNAVLLPQVEGHESEIRELVERILIGAAKSARPGGRIHVSLVPKDKQLSLTVRFPLVSPKSDAARQVLDDVNDLVVAHCEAAGIRSDRHQATIVLRFSAKPD